jgi:hypothetical protein
MIYFILGLDGPHVNVVSHILKKCGLNFNENNDETNLKEYTKNSVFEPYRRHLNDNQYRLDQDYINELYGFTRNELELNQITLATKEFRDYICIQYLLQSPAFGKIIYVDYKYEDINEEFLQSVDESRYNKNLTQLESFLDLAKQSHWGTIIIDYKMFINDSVYRKEILLQIVESEYTVDSVLHNLKSIKTTEDPDDIEDTQFNYIIAQYNDDFASTLLSNIIEEIPSQDISTQELKNYVENQNSKT